jgi:putative copper export protein
VIAALVRGLVLLSLASAIGGLTLELLFPRAAASDLGAARARLRRWVMTSLVVLLLATAAELLARTQAMSGASLTASVAAVPSVVTQTHLGQILAARLVAVVVALLLAFEAGRAFRAFVLLVALAIALSMSLTGHAADWGDVTLSVGARAFQMSRLALFGPSRGTPSAPAESQLVAYVTIEAFVGLVVFACTAVLGEVTPGRHLQFERRPTTHVKPVARPSGSGPRSGTVTPPPEDAAHGRAVFARLECATCHAIPDTQFSAPIQPGPDLAGIGGRHPGEIVESIMSPNAQILDGPGYTSEQGCRTIETS